jgi:hypothetical protein
MEKMKRDGLSDALDSLAALLVREMRQAPALTARQYGHIIDKIRLYQSSLDFNTGVGHICGALAADIANAVIG